MDYEYRTVKWKGIETILPNYPDGVVLIKEDTPVESPLGIVPFPNQRHARGTFRQRRVAKIIVAALELLTALIDLVDRFDPEKQVIYSFAKEQIDRAKAAIKKATE